MANISPTIKIDISIKNGVVEEITIGAVMHSLKKSPPINPSSKNIEIFSPGHTQKCLALIPLLSNIASTPGLILHRFVKNNDRYTHPKQQPLKLILTNYAQLRFIYPIAYTSWVSNPVPVNKKQGTIHVCMDFCDLNHACPKDNFPMPFIDKIIDDCIGHEALSFMDGFSGYNQIQIHPVDQYKTAFTTPWGTFAYRVMPFGLKNARETFQWPMTYFSRSSSYHPRIFGQPHDSIQKTHPTS
jgi:hypothetical protein